MNSLCRWFTASLKLTRITDRSTNPSSSEAVTGDHVYGIQRLCIAISLVFTLSVHEGNAQGSAEASFPDVVALVSEAGWEANLGPLCRQLELRVDPSKCMFHQLSIGDPQQQDGVRAFNVPAQTPPSSEVLLFHLRPSVGLFLVMSAEGNVLKAFVRYRGTGYSPAPLDQMREEVAANKAFWTTNFARIKADLPAQLQRRSR